MSSSLGACKPLILLGAGGHAKVLADLILAAGGQIVGVLDRHAVSGLWHFGIPLLGDDNVLDQYSPSQIDLALGIGSLVGHNLRFTLLQRFVQRGYAFPALVHPHAYVAREVRLDEGVQTMAGAVVQPGVHLGAHVIVNTHASIDHDCLISEHVHIAPGAVLGGEVKVGARVQIGPGAVIGRGVQIGDDAVIGAGASIVRDVPSGVRVIPASMRTNL